ncbi:hypothetical protein ACFV9C_41240 [Kribbella sp. NPDC059898]|uniref:hypothetical protein n=1 Tax=Kribbella sp. NPDC059898 TaxID=3346995 RepID=UPI00364BE5F4
MDAGELAQRSSTAVRSLNTLRGFRRHTGKVTGLTVVLGAFGLTGLLGGVVELVRDRPDLPGFAGAGVLLLGAAIAVHLLRGRRLYAAYRRDGWIAVQAPTGFLLDAEASPSRLRYGPGAGEPLMLIAAANLQPAEFVKPLTAVRRYLEGLTELERDRLGERIRRAGLSRALPADEFFPGTTGCLLGVGTTDLVVVVPPGRLLPVRQQKRGR